MGKRHSPPLRSLRSQGTRLLGWIQGTAMKRYITSESVRKGHPDKLCDLISDSILDACLREDPMSRVAVETMATAGHIIVAGELTTKAKVDIENITRNTLRDAGYSPDRYTLHVLVHPQSEDIKRGVDNAIETRSTTPSRQGSQRRRTPEPVTRERCTATPPMRRRSLCPFPSCSPHSS